MSEKIPEEIVRELKKAARSRDVRAFDRAVNRHKRDLPEDLLGAVEDREILSETMKLIDRDLTDLYSDGVRLKMEHCDDDAEQGRKKKH